MAGAGVYQCISGSCELPASQPSRNIGAACPPATSSSSLAMSITAPAPAPGVGRRYLNMKEERLYLTTRLENLCRPITAGYSDVHRAHFEGTPGDAVAVKHPKYTMDNATLNELMDAAVEKEITILKRVRHPNILPFIGLVRHNGDPCIVTPWMKNGSLRHYLKTRPDADRLDILRDVALAVEYLHRGAELPEISNIIHGDLHAGNVLISDEGKALLADFGLSKLVPLNEQASLSLRPSDKAEGVPCYMAPELHASNALRSLCSDVFAYGMLIYETYAGVRPNVTVDELLSGRRPERASISRNDLTDAVWQVACDCWAHSPSDRPTMREVIAKLGQAPAHDMAPATSLVYICDDARLKRLETKRCDEEAPGLYLREDIDIPFRPFNLTNDSQVYRAHYTDRPDDAVAVRRIQYGVTAPGEKPLTNPDSENEIANGERVQDPGVHGHCILCADTGRICECHSERPGRKTVKFAGPLPTTRVSTKAPSPVPDGLQPHQLYRTPTVNQSPSGSGRQESHDGAEEFEDNGPESDGPGIPRFLGAGDEIASISGSLKDIENVRHDCGEVRRDTDFKAQLSVNGRNKTARLVRLTAMNHGSKGRKIEHGNLVDTVHSTVGALHFKMSNLLRYANPKTAERLRADRKLYLAYEYKRIPEGRMLGGSLGDLLICRQVGKPHVHVAIRFPRYSEDEKMNRRMDRALKKEIMLLKLFKHPNILEYLGLTRDKFATGVGIVYPYAAGRSLPIHLKANNDADRYKLMREVAAGLNYLHSPAPEIVVNGESIRIVHGDIHPGNVLVMSDGRAVLSDFGLSKIVQQGRLMSMQVLTGGADGVAEYLAPEVHKLEDIQLPAGVQPLVEQEPQYAGLRTVKSDVFAFGMLVFATFRGDVRPALGPASVTAAALIAGKRPRREHTLPEEAKSNGRNEKQVAVQLDDDTWALVCDCWKPRAGERPTMEDVCRRLGVV